MPASSEPVIPHQRRYSRSEELSRALSTQLSSNEGEQPVCRSRLMDNRKIEIFKAPALSGPFAYSHSVALSSVVRNASAMSPIGREADIRQNADVNPMHSLRQEAVSHAGRCGARTRSGAPGKSRLSQGVEDVECTVAQMAVAHRAEKGTATTNTADTPERFKRLAAGCARLLICSSS
jgi:hypothetical protein